MIYVFIRKKIAALFNPLTTKSSLDSVLDVASSGETSTESGIVTACLDILSAGTTDTISAVPVVQVEAEASNNALNTVSGISY